MPQSPQGPLSEVPGQKDFHGEIWHTLEGRVIREIIFGANDGLITAFGFVSGVNGAEVRSVLIFLTGLAAAVAGAISMFFGSYLSTKAQREFFEGEIEREKREIENEPQRETDEIRQIYSERGFAADEIESLVKIITKSKERLLAFMIREELGLVPEHFDSPLKSAAIIGISFFLGAFLPVIPYAFMRNGLQVMAVSAAVTLVSLFAVGAGKTRVTKTGWFSGGIEMLAVGALAGGIGFGVGRIMAYFGLGSGS